MYVKKLNWRKNPILIPPTLFTRADLEMSLFFIHFKFPYFKNALITPLVKIQSSAYRGVGI